MSEQFTESVAATAIAGTEEALDTSQAAIQVAEGSAELAAVSAVVSEVAADTAQEAVVIAAETAEQVCETQEQLEETQYVTAAQFAEMRAELDRINQRLAPREEQVSEQTVTPEEEPEIIPVTTGSATQGGEKISVRRRGNKYSGRRRNNPG